MDYGLIWLVLLPASLFDLSRYRIPNSIPVAGLVYCLVRHLELQGLVGIETWLVGMIVPGILYYFLFRLHAFGASDGKLMAVVGSLVGVPDIFTVIVFSIIVGALMGTIKLYLNGHLLVGLQGIYSYFSDIRCGNIHPYCKVLSKEDGVIPFSVAISIGVLLYYLCSIL